MATTTSLQSPHQSLLHHHHHCFTTSPDSIFFKPAKSYKLFSILSTTSSSSPLTTPATTTTTTTTTSSSSSNPLDVLAGHLSSSDFRQADEETRRLLVALAGEAAQRRGYVFFSEVQFISAADLRAIDRLWRQHSGGRFGYSVQRRVWEKSGRDFTRFFIRVGWMKRLESTEVEQYGYRSFPGEFMWELKVDGEPPPPEGHLPLTNALRGTQLLRSILTHPAFEAAEEEDEEEEKQPKLMGGANRIFKPDYSL